MNNRLKDLRKSLNFTQQEFANSLGIKRNTIATYESGRNIPIDAVISLICTRFNVNEDWLRNGTGDMFVELTPDEEIEQFIGDVLNDEEDNFKRRFISSLAKLDASDWLVLEKIVDSLIEKD